MTTTIASSMTRNPKGSLHAKWSRSESPGTTRSLLLCQSSIRLLTVNELFDDNDDDDASTVHVGEASLALPPMMMTPSRMTARRRNGIVITPQLSASKFAENNYENNTQEQQTQRFLRGSKQISLMRKR
jgi:hypothetical protein